MFHLSLLEMIPGNLPSEKEGEKKKKKNHTSNNITNDHQ